MSDLHARAAEHLRDALTNMNDVKQELYERTSVGEMGRKMWVAAEESIKRAMAELRAAGGRCVPESTHSFSFKAGAHGVTVGKRPGRETWQWTVWCLDGPGILHYGFAPGMQEAIAAAEAAEAETEPRGGETDAED